MREFLYNEDMARVCIFLMKNYNAWISVDSGQHVNIGSGIEVSIKGTG
jgi:GDP-L-fucose synthase